MEGLPRKKEHLRTFLGRYAPPEDGQHLPQGLPGEADNDISTPGLCFTHGQANNLAPREAKAKATNKTR